MNTTVLLKSTDVSTIINNNKYKMTEQYFYSYALYTRKYGEKVVLIWQCGDFMEVYGLKDPETGEIGFTGILEFGKICNLNVACKKTKVWGQDLYEAGWPIRNHYDKYIPKLLKEGYTVVEVIEYAKAENSEKKLRKENRIFTAGTYFNESDNELSNFTVSIYFEWFNKSHFSKMPSFNCGYCAINILTGKTYFNEYRVEDKDIFNVTRFDRLYDFLNIYNPSEIYFTHNIDDENILNNIIQFTTIDRVKHTLNHKDKDMFVKKYDNDIYIKEIFEEFFSPPDYNYFLKNTYLDKNTYAARSIAFIIDTIKIQYPSLVDKIYEPIFEENNSSVFCAIHSLEQLHIMNKDTHRYSSVIKCLNKTKTPMGKRLFNYKLLHPIHDIKTLNNDYDIIEYITNNNDAFTKIYSKLSALKDIEKIYRKIVLKTIKPIEIVFLHENVSLILSIAVKIKQKFRDYYDKRNDVIKDIINYTSNIKQLIEKYINIEKAKEYSEKDPINYFNNGIYTELDTFEKKFNIAKDKIIDYKNKANEILNSVKKTKSKTEYVKIYGDYKNKNGINLMITDSKKTELEKLIKKNKIKLKLNFQKALVKNKHNVFFENKYTFYTDTKVKFDKFVDSINIHYTKFINMMSELKNKLGYISSFIGILDVDITKYHISREFNYCKPTIIDNCDHSYLDAYGLRHAIIEQIPKTDMYVKNDVHLNKEYSGIMLFGTNAVGKSSLIRAIGICTIMAQAGMYVPCDEFIYKPYTKIFTRIHGNDNIFKGMSSFITEMCELSTILRDANKNSLILGDELCSGTEAKSAISLFLSGLISLEKKNSSYIFATHFHEILKLPHMDLLKNIALKHMTVEYDRENDELIYNRKLKDGSGDDNYGILVASALNMPEEFIQMANEISKNLRKKKKTSELKKNKYNSKILKKKTCEMHGCDNEASDIDHMIDQKYANEKGFNKLSHKNAVSNLISICKDCHDKKTRSGMVTIRKKTSKGTKLVFENYENI